MVVLARGCSYLNSGLCLGSRQKLRRNPAKSTRPKGIAPSRPGAAPTRRRLGGPRLTRADRRPPGVRAGGGGRASRRRTARRQPGGASQVSQVSQTADAAWASRASSSGASHARTRITGESEAFIRDFADQVEWAKISEYQQLSTAFVEEFAARIIWSMFSRNKNLTDEQRLFARGWFGAEYRAEVKARGLVADCE